MSDQRVFSQHASDLRTRQVPRIRLRGLARANLLLTSLGIIALLLAGCASGVGSPSGAGSSSTGGASRQPAGSITEYPAPHGPTSITMGPDGNLWFTEDTQIGRISPGT